MSISMLNAQHKAKLLTEWAVFFRIRSSRARNYEGPDGRPIEDHGCYQDVATKMPLQEEDPERVRSNDLVIFIRTEPAGRCIATTY